MTKPREIGSHKEALRRMIKDEMGGMKDAAFVLGLGSTQVYAQTDLDHPAEMTFANVLRLLRASKNPRAVPELIGLACGGEFVAHTFEEAPIDALLARSAKEYGEVVAAALKAMSTQLSKPDAQTLIRELQDLGRIAAHCVHELQRRMG